MNTNWLRTDFHLHATRYRAIAPRPDVGVAEIVKTCIGLGLQTVGIVEHLDASSKHPLTCLEDLVAEFRQVQDQLGGEHIEIFVGAELDAAAAALSVPEAAEIRRTLGLDYCLGSVHGFGPDATDWRAALDDYRRRIMLLVEAGPEVDVIGHPWAAGRSLLRRGFLSEWRWEMIPTEFLNEFVDALDANDKAMELNPKARPYLNEASFREFMARVRDRGIRVSVGSDAHSLDRIGGSIELTEHLAGLGFAPEQLWTPRAS